MSVPLSISLIIETTSWTIRALSTPGSSGIFIARTNIYLYGGRLFALLYIIFMSYLVDKGANTSDILSAMATAYLLTWATHVAFRHSSLLKRLISTTTVTFLRLPVIDGITRKEIVNNALRQSTLIATLFFVAAMSLPYVLAASYPTYRMTFSSLGQIINSFGTLILLFIVDPKLYKLMDEKKLSTQIFEYERGRTLGFGIGGATLMLLSQITFF